MSDIPVLLVHGACHGAWCWERVLPELAARGIRAAAVDLPGLGLDPTPPEAVTMAATAAKVVDAARALGGRVMLAGHSAGGYAISAAALAAPELVGKLLFLCAYLPQDGLSLSEMRKVWHQQPLLPAIRRAADGHSFTFAGDSLAGLFYHDCPPGTLDFARPRLRPQPMATQTTPLALTPGFAALEKHYVVCADDRAIPPDYQRVMARSAQNVTELPCAHSPFFALPGTLADRIAAACAA